jgi:hypothetical protein
MRATLTIRLYRDIPPIVKIDLRNYNPTRTIDIKMVIIFVDGDTYTAFKRSWQFRIPRPITSDLQLLLLGVTYTAAIFDGLLRGQEIGVTEPEVPTADGVDWDVTAEWPRED